MQWAQRSENQQAWEEMAQKHGLKGNPFESGSLARIFQFLDFATLVPYPSSYSMTKARKVGWNGFVDSIESHMEVIEEMAAMKMVPAIGAE